MTGNMTQTNNEHEAVAVLNTTWGSDTGWQYNIKLLPSFETDKYLESIEGHDIYLYLSPPKQAIPEGWISTKDRLPDQLELKIKLIDGSEIYAWYQSDGDYYWNCGGREIFIDESKVTHWMPLPSSPTTSLTSETNTEVGE